jgi:hypothetical protein
VPQYCSEQSINQAPKMYNSFIHLFVWARHSLFWNL